MPFRRRRYRAVLFDLGGTLVEDRDFVEVARIADEASIASDPDAVAAAMKWASEEFDRRGSAPPSDAYWALVLSRAADREVPPESVERFLVRLERLPRSAPLFSDVRRTLERLRRQGRALAVVSNSPSEAAVEATLRDAGIRPYFRSLTSSGTEGVAKPDPEIFRRAAAKLGVAVEEAFYVGDLAVTDAKAASAAGMGAVWLHRDGTGFGEDPPEITSLTELPRWVTLAEGASVK